MKAICIGRNYSEHIQELGNAVPEQPIIFTKSPDNIYAGHTLTMPTFTQDLHYECELVCRFNQDVTSDFVGDWREIVSEVTLGIDLTARDIQEYLKAKSLPWELAKDFRQSAIIGSFVPVEDVIVEEGHIVFDFYKNNQMVQKGDTRFMIFDINSIVQFVLKYFDIKAGDILFTGTPKGVGKINIGDGFRGVLNSKEILNVNVVA